MTRSPAQRALTSRLGWMFHAVALLAGGSPALGQCLEDHKLVPVDGAPRDYFGASVALGGDFACIGSPRALPSGAAVVYRRSEGGWLEFQRLSPGDGGGPEEFGRAVAMSGDLILVGNPGTPNGDAVVYRFDGAAWNLEQVLVDADGSRLDFFGSAVAVEGKVAVVGAWLDDNLGSAVVFRFDGASWVQEQKLFASDPHSAATFGWSVALSGDRILVGAPDVLAGDTDRAAAVCYRHDGARWNEEQMLFPTPRAESFGWAVALDGATAFVGAPGDDQVADAAGAAYVFQQEGSRWQFHQKLVERGGRAGTKLGASVALSGDHAVVGAAEIEFFAKEAGKVLAYERQGRAWVQRAVLQGSDVDLGDHFAGAVALGDGQVLVGADQQNLSVDTPGAAYAYTFPSFGLEIDPPSIQAGETVTFTTARGAPSDRAVLFLCELDGVPFVQHVRTGQFGADGTWPVCEQVPPAFSGSTLTFVAFGIDACGEVRATAVQTLRVQ